MAKLMMAARGTPPPIFGSMMMMRRSCWTGCRHASLDRHRPASTRSLAEEEALEASLRQPANLDRFARVLKPGGTFRFASDIDSYVNWTLLQCRAHGGFDGWR